jgi:hypothetical protein
MPSSFSEVDRCFYFKRQKTSLEIKKRPHLSQDNGNWLPSFEGPLALRHWLSPVLLFT